MNSRKMHAYDNDVNDVEDDGLVLLGSRFLRAIQEQNRRPSIKMRRELDDGNNWYRKQTETYRDRC